ncbi:helix-turn-helix domain-containing protein [Bacillus sp. B15-48]|uniref:helix-turn-helix domain-containing protein n=1 Tax=Bacillus sp. B15-48 TaxID=1548601 RepID=UPI00193FE5B6|nr:helix-turn-helix domain-containing protein [Bacillus sp. B15-48]MBM4763122.1 helix-turn-helix domain-containing protein [Bacillus sp. B15-48]
MGEILIVDDDLKSIQIFRSVVSESKFNFLSIYEAESAEEAMVYLKQKQPQIMVLDLSLPDEDGMVLGKKALEIYPHLPVVVLTQLQTFDTIQNCINAGFSGYLLKSTFKSNILALFDRFLTISFVLKGDEILDRTPTTKKAFELDLANPIETATKYIQLNFFEPLTLSEVANLVYLSPSHFSRKFKDAVGLNFVEYLIKFRIKKAKKLLQITQLPLEVISNHCGFSSAAHFSATFKKIEGVSPRVYRKLYSELTENVE